MNYYVVDAFADKLFRGNPAGVCILEHEIPDTLMQKIAAENNLSETAFLYKNHQQYNLRWFTPTFEIDLCGHATLATAYVLCTCLEPHLQEVSFHTVSGILHVIRHGDRFEMSFPLRTPEKIPVTQEMITALGTKPLKVYAARDLYVLLENEQAVKDFVPDYQRLSKLSDWMGIAVTAKGTDADFVSRFFCPELKLEDPVTGSSHSSLVPLWHEKLGKTDFLAKQLSERGGVLYCSMGKEDVKISGEAKLYLHGEIFVPEEA